MKNWGSRLFLWFVLAGLCAPLSSPKSSPLAVTYKWNLLSGGKPWFGRDNLLIVRIPGEIQPSSLHLITSMSGCGKMTTETVVEQEDVTVTSRVHKSNAYETEVYFSNINLPMYGTWVVRVRFMRTGETISREAVLPNFKI